MSLKQFTQSCTRWLEKVSPFPDFPIFIFSGFCFGWICIFVGIWLNQFGRSPVVNQMINSTYAVGHATYNKFLKPNRYSTKNFFWLPERYALQGAVMHSAEQFSEGYTLLVSAHHQGAELLSHSGEVVHQWQFPLETLLENRFKPEYLYWWQAQVLPNGDVIAIATVDNHTPAGLGIIKLDKDSNLLWFYPAHAHHDFAIAANGDIYFLEQGIQGRAPSHLDFLAAPYLNEWLTVIDAQGKFKKRINLYDALAFSPYKKSLRRIQRSITGDYLHPNSVKLIDEQLAQKAPYLSANSALIDLRELDAMIAIDLDSETVNWLIHGPWFYQHDPDILDNGNILLFDNLSLGAQSRVIEYNPQNQKVVWEYKGTEAQPLFSAIRGNQQKLDNGNVLIVESNASRLLEVNMQGELVWEYYSPVRRQDFASSIQYAPAFLSAHRYSFEELEFLQLSQRGD